MFDGDMRRFVNETLVSKQHYLRNLVLFRPLGGRFKLQKGFRDLGDKTMADKLTYMMINKIIPSVKLVVETFQHST